MAQTLNPSASVFRPSYPDDMNLDLESFLPDRLLVSPNSRHYRSFEPVPFCRSPREYTGYHHSELPYNGDLSFLDEGRVWDDYSVCNLKQEFLKMERDLGRFPRRPTKNSKPANYEFKHYQQRHNSCPPQRHNSCSLQQPYQVPPQRIVQRQQRHQRRTPPQQKKPVDFRSTPPKHHKKGQVLPKYDVECLLHLVRSQLEFYFSDQNLYEEMHSNLQYYMKLDSDKWVPVHVLLDLPSVAKLTSEKEVVLQALRSSNLLELNDDETKCRRPNYVTPADYKVRKNLRRSVLVYGLPEQMTDEEVRRLLDMHGNILCVAFAGMDEGPDPEIASVIMKKKFNDLNIDNLKTAFVVFESQSQANKCVKSRSRHSVDGIRTMHKYDYNKVVKRLGKGQSPLMTPSAPNTAVPKAHNGMNNVNNNHGGNFHPNSKANNFQMNSVANKRTPLAHHHQANAANSPPQMPIFLKRNHNSMMNNNVKPPNFRKNVSHKWRSPTKGSDSLNWRVNNSPMMKRSNSTQNRSLNSAGGEFSKYRYSKENLSTYPVLNTRAH